MGASVSSRENWATSVASSDRRRKCVSKSSVVLIPSRRNASNRGRGIQLKSSSFVETLVIPFGLVLKPFRPRASPRSACQPKSRRHIHQPQCGMRHPRAAPEFHWSRRRNRRHDDADPPDATEIQDAFRLRLGAPQRVRPHAQKKVAADFHFRTAAKARGSEETRRQYL